MRQRSTGDNSFWCGRGSGAEMLEDWRALQEQLLDLEEFFSQRRLGVWQEEKRRLEGLWADLSGSWEEHLETMAVAAEKGFDRIAGTATAASVSLSQDFSQAFQGVSQDIELLEGRLTQTMEAAASLRGAVPSGGWQMESDPLAWAGNFLGGDWLEALDWFHHGGIVRAHQGMAIEPEYLSGLSSLGADERLVIAQTGEGILPRESMARLGQETFEALRTGQFDSVRGQNPGTPTYQIAIQVQALDADSMAGFNWERVVKRHIVPALQRERRWD